VSDDEKVIHLTESEIIALAEVLDREREGTKMLIELQPQANLENIERREYMKKLETLSSRLLTQIEK